MHKVIRQSKPFIFRLKIFFTFISWSILLYILFFIHPHIWKDIYYLPFFVSIFATLFLTINLIIPKPAFFILIPLGTVFIIAIRIFLIKDFINPLLVSGLVITLIYFFTSSSRGAILPKTSNSIHKSQPKQIDNYASFPQTNRPKPGKTN